ncbi:hypothetical protein L1D31_22335 [Vibrio sp. Isolate23]|uniref:hypothetical protein n=1 Tax=Vibrio sp. Isolate23 TaxID=2908533 RepID=UPI001EFD697D|nr:hypothetical protein [Vibrio sp. Isolate23]MCG9685258.1 hypothetical protein [Vibrio sp. Isolate23]
MNKHYKLVEIDLPTETQLSEMRATKHADHLDYFYGEHWNTFINRDHKCFLEFDVGHFASEFIVREITYEHYCSLKKDKSLFEAISMSVR